MPCVAVSVSLFLTAVSATAAPKDEVAAATRQWTTVFAENDPDKMLALYASDGVLWGTLSPIPRSDPAAVRAFFR